IPRPAAPRRETAWPEIAAYTRRARESWQRWHDDPGPTPFGDVCGSGFEHVVLVALGEAAAFLGEDGGPGLELVIETDLPVGRGFGSSAATAAGTVAAYLGLRGAVVTRAELQRLAVEVERRQHGLPSGVDPATVLHGGVLWAERDAAGELVVSPIAGASLLLSRLAVFDTGQPPEPTGEVVGRVRELQRRDPATAAAAWNAIEAATRALRDLLVDPAAPPRAALPLLRRSERALEALGVVPEPVRRVVREIEAAGGAAKVSGAGSLAGPGAGCLLALHEDPARLAGIARPGIAPRGLAPAGAGRPGAELGVERLAVGLGGPGLAVEAGP
ncbi:MAG TPA: hypothetical protein VHQ65_04130, partial [Thermoanaerobaculia bacterium]|nr:hypothetical protein [Thermoanaerobaculia bacterium]